MGRLVDSKVLGKTGPWVGKGLVGRWVKIFFSRKSF